VDVVDKPVAVKLEKSVKKKLTAWNSEMLPAMKRARKASTRGRKLRVTHVPSLEKQVRTTLLSTALVFGGALEVSLARLSIGGGISLLRWCSASLYDCAVCCSFPWKTLCYCRLKPRRSFLRRSEYAKLDRQHAD